MTSPMLKVRNIQSNYGEVRALHDISLDVEQGEIIVLLGVNGAGKSTTLKTISGLIHPSNGSMTFRGQPIDRLSPERVVRMGISHVPEGRHVFPGLTVRENLIMGTSNRRVTSPRNRAGHRARSAYFP